MLNDHPYLDDTDECYFWGEYTAYKGYAHSETNQLILNFKKTVNKKNTLEWQYKLDAINQAARFFSTALNNNSALTFIPIPPSKVKTDPLYDDRIIKLLNAINLENKDIRELIFQRTSYCPSHSTNLRLTPIELANNYEIDEQFVNPKPKIIVVFDDVLTTGSHFKAMKKAISERFNDVRIIGVFIARRVPEANEFDQSTL